MKILGLIITTKSRERRKLKESYLQGLNVGDCIGYQRRKMDEDHKGIIMPGYDLDKDLEEILRGKE